MKEDLCAELFLLNRNFDRALRVLQRLDRFAIWNKRERKAYEVRLEEIRAALNADFAEAMAARERADETRLRMQRTAWEAQKSNGTEQ